MPRKKFAYKGKTLEELTSMSFEEFLRLLPARQRRSIGRGFSTNHKGLIEKIRSMSRSGKGSTLRTHCRDFVVIPEMVGMAVEVYDGHQFQRFEVQPEMIGHYLGEFGQTRQRVQHSAPGGGATKSSKYVPLK